MFVGVVRYHLDHAQDRFMVRIVEIIQLFILPVNSKRILCQIVCSDTEEVYNFSKTVTDHYRSRSLDHNSLFRNPVLDLFLL